MSGRAWPMRALPVVAALTALWSLLPLAAWWDGGDLGYFRGAWETWGWGSGIAALAAAMALLLTRGRVVAMLLAGWRRIMAVPAPVFVGVVSLVLALLTLLATLLLFDGNPRNVDGFAQLFQARVFLSGRVFVTPPQELAHFATLQMILGPDRWLSQYPPGQAAVLAVGLAAGAWWLLNPLLAAAFAVATWRVGRWCAGDSAARLTLLLLCVSPMVVAVAGSEMSHLGAATLGMAAAAAATLATERRPALFGGAAGLLLGLMTAFRPLDAVAATLPVALILVSGAGRLRALAAAAVLGVAGSAPTLWYNAATTGSWRTFGYTALWGPQHSLGFHEVPWGIPLTPLRALARSGLDLHQLNTYLFDGVAPTLVLIAVGVVAGRRGLTARDAVPWAGLLALVGLLFFYWHRDVFYGPRFLYSAAAWSVLLLARALVLLRRAAGDVSGRSGPAGAALLFAAAALVLGLATLTPTRLLAYRRSTPIFGLHPDRDARRNGITDAVVVIPDGWGSRLIARMWELGVPVNRSTRLYGAIDACALEQALSAAEADPAARARLLRTLDSLASLGRPGARAGVTEDENLRLPPPPLPAVCMDELTFDRAGFLSFAPFLWLNAPDLDGPIVWARDLGDARNARLLARYPDRRAWRYAPDRPGGVPAFRPLPR